MIQVGEVTDSESLPLENAEPLLDLVHPRAMHWQKVAHKAGMGREPGLNQSPLMHFEVVEDQVHAGLGSGKLLLQLGQEGHELHLALSCLGTSIHLARAG